MTETLKKPVVKYILSLLATAIPVIVAVYFANIKTQAANDERLDQHDKEIIEIKQCAAKKADLYYVDHIANELNKRLDGIENSQKVTENDVKQVLILLNKK